MKKAYHYTSWRLNDKNEFCGINFGYDFCAEHEMGISGIRESFGIKTYSGNKTIVNIKKSIGVKPTFGLDARIVKKKPQELQFKQKGEFCGIYYSSSVKLSDTAFDEGIKALSWEMNKPNGNDVVCYWGNNSFMFITTNEPNFQAIKKLLNENAAAIFIAGKHGLVICDPEKLDDRTKTELYSSDLNAWELKKSAEDCGIEKELIKSKKEFLALTPGWKNPAKKEIHFFLNPHNQRKYNSGWFTVEELKEWIEEKGPILKTTKK